MAYDLEEQKQLDNFKAFWDRFGNLISWVLILALGGYAAYNFWNTHQRNQAVEASGMYDQLVTTSQAGDNAKTQRYASDIESKYGSTAYAQMAGLVAAKSAFDANDLKTARAQLQWVVDHGNEQYQSVARLRLAGVLLDDKAYDEALKTLSADILPQFAADVSDRKGDILAAQNKLPEARAAYQAALEKLDASNPGRRLIQIKLDAIGGSDAAKPAASAKAPA